jgi:hypothetical protein
MQDYVWKMGIKRETYIFLIFMNNYLFSSLTVDIPILQVFILQKNLNIYTVEFKKFKWQIHTMMRKTSLPYIVFVYILCMFSLNFNLKIQYME